ncbi:peptidyl-prolyl cis-trans isomerase, putative [Hepatocystis sp. ex Piliocolobus tephrosceles]|uniref:Spliceosome-associated protein CWC27 homolog n=1 Tax=Piliocolobus tephrosceles TaxID=591936 RepID=A0A8C9GQE4_9PRIM|nr:peptidyl-prolyl cis-trans isomerase, putative [Hepatocystis sp. ex Piliocolobus tephrosceles]
MSEVYSIEPKTHGKVIIYTSLGELEVLLFSNECPIACKNFIQLCLNNYYNKNKFFRIIPKFLIQTGDHTNTGLHNEYAFKEPFPNEFNRRLKFLYMGCLSFANLNINTPSNGSQFFITLDKVEYLNNKSTLFGKVAKHSLYNLLKFNNIKTNKNDEPIEDIPYIEYIKIIENPFYHLVPYTNYDAITSSNKIGNTKELKTDEKYNNIVQKKKKKINNNLLSFNSDNSENESSDNHTDNHFLKKEKQKTTTEAVVTEATIHSAQSDNEDNDILQDKRKKNQTDYNHNQPHDNINKNENTTSYLGAIKRKNEVDKDSERGSQKKTRHNLEGTVKKETKQEKKVSDKSSIEKTSHIKTNQEKIDIYKEKIKKITERNKNKNEKTKTNENNLQNIGDLSKNLDEVYLKKNKKKKKMSKKEREMESLKRLEEFNARLNNLFSKSTSKGDNNKPDWVNTDGLKFHIDSSNAYEYEDVKKKG